MKHFLLILSSLFIFACANETMTPAEKAASDAFAEAEKNYSAEVNKNTINAYIDSAVNFMAASPGNKERIISLSEKAYAVAKENKVSSKLRGFLFTLIKEDYGNSNTPSRMLELADQMSQIKRAGTANIIYKSLIENFPSSAEGKSASSKIDPSVSNIQNYIINIGEKIAQGEVDKYGFNKNAALKYVDACEAYALVYPDAPDAPSHLYKAAEIAKAIQTLPKLLSIYDWVIDKYPNFDKTPTMYFLKGFTLENDLKDDAAAKKVYEEFIQKYPKHELRDDIDFLLEHLGKSDEEIRKIIESKNANKKE